MSDIGGYITQSASDKLIASAHYPLVVVERNEAFPGCTSLALAAAGAGEIHAYSAAEIDRMFAECVNVVQADDTRSEPTIHDQLYAFGGSIVQQARHILLAADDPQYDGPSRAELQSIVDGGIEHLGKSLRAIMGDWGIYAWCPHFRVTVKSAPLLKLASPRIDLDGLRLEVRATGELYAKFPWWNCHRWCTQWRKVIKCERIASVTVSPEVAIDAHAQLAATGATVVAQARFDRLRLDYPILRELPLEQLANLLLARRTLTVYDASALIASVPVLGSRFGVASIDLPPRIDAIEVGVTLRRV